jgi:hypothetical protein
MFGFCCGIVVVLLWLRRLNLDITPYRLVQTEHFWVNPPNVTPTEKKNGWQLQKKKLSMIILIAFLSEK